MSGLQIAKMVGLEIQTFSTATEIVKCENSLRGVEEILRQKFTDSRAVFVAWQVQNIIWGKFDGDKLSVRADFNPALWLECRIFNRTAELHLKRQGGVLRGRYIIDTAGGETRAVDSFTRLWGKNSGAQGGFVKLVDKNRKLAMEIPCEKISDWYGLLTRNYISTDDSTGLCGYGDYRFVAIEPAKEGADIG